ncbi:MAG TPA: magnesium/cobalt transporter CorA [Bacteroidales bacterium]|nr:magnesium/cobalt transporter CorA [Bacteroidales bacterium]
MGRFIFKQKKEIGLSPDELYFRGQKKIDKVLLRVIDFDADNLEESAVDTVEEVLKYQRTESVTWFNIDGLHNKAIMEEITRGFKFDNLILAGVMDTHSRPKVQEFPNCILISIKMLQQEEPTGSILVENLSLILTEKVLITFQEKRGDVFEPIRERIRAQKKRIRNSETDYLAFTLLDIVVDNYIYIISEFGNKIEDLEEKLHPDPDQSIIDQINSYKQELNYLRKNINPAKEMILALSKMESEFIYESTYVHFKELLDNITHATESTDNYREILSDQLNIYHTTMSTKLNDIMKFLTVFSVIFIPLTFIAGIYGTNFDVVPELHYKYSYFIMWGVIVILALGMLRYFRKKKWF